MPQAKVDFGPRVAGKKTFPPPKKETGKSSTVSVKLNKVEVKSTTPAPKAAPAKVEPKKEEPKAPEGKAPKFTQKLQSEYKATKGEKVKITCKIEGEPEPDVDWLLNGKVVKDEGRYQYIFEGKDVIGLQIDDVSADDAGEYKCVVFNKSGKVEAFTNLAVNVPKPVPAPAAEPAKVREQSVTFEDEQPAKKEVVNSDKLKQKTFTPNKSKKSKLPVDRKGIKAENPEKYYTFGEEIGRGKFSIVKECESKTSGKKYAAKIIKFDSESLKFAIREYDLMVGGKLDNKRTVKLHEAYLVRKYLILIMDLVEGKTLLEKVSGFHSLTEDDVADFVRQICEILADWKSRNIVHLDIRPTNIRFSSGRELKLLDYNSARHIANKKAGEVVDVIGDTEFCAPELLNFDPVGPGSDMWSLAVIMYILLSGISPYFYEDEDKVLECVQKVQWKFDPDAFANVTPEAKDFIKKCFVRIPENRLTVEDALNHNWLSSDYQAKRKLSKLECQDTMRETDERLCSEEEEEYIEASLVFRTFDEEEYESPEEESDEEDE